MMPRSEVLVGIDVSERELEIRVLSEAKSWRVPNTAKGHASLVKLWSGAPVTVGLEPSGGYERSLVEALTAAGVDVRWANPDRVRALAKALGAPAKTDAIDAELIARFIESTGGSPVQLDADRQVLRDLIAARDALLDTAERLTGQKRLAPPGAAREALERIAAQAADEAKALTERLLDAIAASPRLAPTWRLLQTAPGIGRLLAAQLVADMPELGQVSRKAIAKLAGLAPFIRKSGKWTGKATCSGGRTRPRCALFMAAMASLRARNGLRPVYERLVANGKPRMVALTACMRRLLVTLNAMVANQTPWQHIPA